MESPKSQSSSLQQRKSYDLLEGHMVYEGCYSTAEGLRMLSFEPSGY